MVRASYVKYICIIAITLGLWIGGSSAYANTGSNNDSGENDRAQRQEQQSSPSEESNSEDSRGSSTATPSSPGRRSERGEGSNEGQVSYDSFTNFPGIGRISNLCQLTTALWYLGFAVLFLSVIGSILYGGFLYTSAGVNAAQVNQAKGVIQNAFVGLVLGLSVVIILQTVDPNLLGGNCQIQSIEPFSYSSPTIGAGGDGIAISGETSFPMGCDYARPSAGQRYGAPRRARNGIHMGTDLAPSTGTACPILAFQDGEVTSFQCNGPIIRHADGLETRYYHNSSNTVQVGDRVTAGQVIGYAGDEKCGSQGVHLHFEILRNGSYLNPENIIYGSNFQPNENFINSNVRAR